MANLYDYVQANQFGSWDKVFKSADKELKLISNHLSNMGEYYPGLSDIFKTFELCPLDKVKVVILEQDPYHSVENGTCQANGLSFSTNIGKKVQPSLVNIYKHIKKEYPEFEIPIHGDLSKWATQGVLLLNTCLTVTPHQAGSHKKIWNGFITRVFTGIAEVNPKCIYVLWGGPAQSMEPLLNPQSIKLRASHPSPFWAYKSNKNVLAFMECDHFRMINKYLSESKKDEIDWQI